jgi:hypothetical protein
VLTRGPWTPDTLAVLASAVPEIAELPTAADHHPKDDSP